MTDLYLGREVDLESGELTDKKASYNADRLVTHAVGVGMTGSGKTGLCVGLLEELADAGVPMVIIDPKGDMANLALLFEDFDPADFAEWVDPGEAQRAGSTQQAHGEKMAGVWKEGLNDWGIDGERIKRLRERLALTIYTPGSDSGTPVDVLGAFSAPSRAVRDDETACRELITGTVSGLLGLVDIEADPVRDPEHVVLSRIVHASWTVGEDLDVRKLIERLVDPPFERVGVFSVDEFFPPKSRRKLAMKLNGIIAAPAFEPWTRGAPLDVDAMANPIGSGDKRKVPVSLFYLAHLSDTERMFFASLLLEQIVAWSRAQSGTSSLRMLVYFDEVFGYLPPYPRNPPTKTPILTLMKQARAVGVGTVLVTQNPVDVDYKALSNAGTWFIGRLQTQRDRERVLDGLMSAGGDFSTGDLNDLLDKLRTRVFLLHDVKANGPRLFHTRWAMSFLRGPMARREIEKLMASGRLHKPATTAEVVKTPKEVVKTPKVTKPLVPVKRPSGRLQAARSDAPDATVVSMSEVVTQAGGDGSISVIERVMTLTPRRQPLVEAEPRWQPQVPEGGVPSLFLRSEIARSARLCGLLGEWTQPARNDGRVRYAPALYAVAELRFDEARAGFDLRETQHRLFFPLTESGVASPPIWPAFREGDTTATIPTDGWFDDLPAGLDERFEFEAVKESVVTELIERQSRGMWLNRALGLYGRPNETRIDFLSRCSVAADRRADQQISALRAKYSDRTGQLERDLRRAYEQLASLHSKADRLHHEAIAAAAAKLMGAFTGNDMPPEVRAAWLKVKGAKTSVADLDQQLAALQLDLDRDLAEAKDRWTPLVSKIDKHDIRLDRSDITFPFFGVLWLPITKVPV